MTKVARKTLGIALIVAGSGAFAAVLATFLLARLGSMERVEAPGSRTLALEPGDYTLYWETDSRFSRVPALSDLDVRVGDLPVPASGLFTSRYSTLDRVGVSIASVTVPAKGEYPVSVQPRSTVPNGRLAIQRSLGLLGVLRLVAIGLVLLGGGVGGGVAVLVRKPKPPAA